MSEYRRDHSVVSASGLRVALVASRYHADIVGRMTDGAGAVFAELGGEPSALERFIAPGSFELPVIAAVAARSGRFDAVVVLGCIVQGETRHDQVIANAIAGALADLSVEAGIPVGFGVLTVSDKSQAAARAGGDVGNKGAEAMRAAIECVGAVRAASGERPAGALR